MQSCFGASQVRESARDLRLMCFMPLRGRCKDERAVDEAWIGAKAGAKRWLVSVSRCC
jgi:hypothetical protein